jgi:hypothetical protein
MSEKGKMKGSIQTTTTFPRPCALRFRIPAVLLLFGLTGFLQALDFKLGGAREVPPPIPAIPKQQFLPDGHLTVFQDDSEVWMFWPFEDSYRTSGSSIFEMRDPIVSLPRGPAGRFDSGGAWLYTVLQGREGRLLGFYHAEDRSFPLSPESNFIAYKSIARCTSDDFGESWQNREQILTSRQPKPQRAKWSGLGDHCIVWDHDKRRLVCFYQEGGLLHMAESRDSQGHPGTWKKWYRGGFTEPGLGGRSKPIPAFAKHPGGNPSVLWNTFLERWLIVWHQWRGDLWISSSRDLMEWTPPKILLKKPWPRGKTWYPTLLGSSDKTGGEKLLLLYAEFPDADRYERRFMVRKLILKKSVNPHAR